MNFKEIQELIKLISKSEVSHFKIKEGDFEMTIKTIKEVPQNTMSPQVIAVPAAPVVHTPAPAMITPAVAQKSAAGSEASTTAESNRYLEIKSPMVGTFYRSPGPDKPQFVKVGDPVESGTTVCIIEAMKLFNEIESEIKGTIVKIMVDDASPVEYDQVLFLVEP